ncbi:MAG TPA: PhoU domain-containing protein [Allosphingosinicella sp.]|nr:PhoU domain-containing protein [Allosphingosinicella sp.]
MPNSGAHTVTAFDDDLDALRGRVAALGGAAEAAVREAMEALFRLDPGLAAHALARARSVATGAEDVERRGICLIALRAPRADDLREVLAALKIVGLIERVAEHARGIAAAAAPVGTRNIAPPPALGTLARLALDAVRAALDAFAARDASASEPVDAASHQAEELYGLLLEDALGRMRRDPRAIGAGTSLLLVARSLSRIADQAANIGRAVSFSVTGQPAAPVRREPADMLAKAS